MSFLKQKYLFLVFICSVLSSVAQFEPNWMKTMSTYSSSYPACIYDPAGYIYSMVNYQDSMCLRDPLNSIFCLQNPWGRTTLIKYDINGNVIWHREIETNNNTLGYTLQLDSQGNLLVSGKFWGRVDLDTGTDSLLFNSNGGGDIFIAKYDSNGVLIWGEAFGGTQDEYPRTLAINADGTLFFVGTFQQTVDFDPGPGSYPMTATGGTNSFLLRLSSIGGFINALKWDPFLSLGNVFGDGSNNVYASGSFTNSGDFDPGPSIHTETEAIPGSAGFIMKFDSALNFKWVKCSDANYISTYLTPDHKIYASGSFSGLRDVAPGNQVYMLQSVNNSSDVYVMRLDTSGAMQWVQSYGGSGGYDTGNISYTDTIGNIYMAGTFKDSIELDPGPGYFSLSGDGSYDAYTLQLDSLGNFQWALGVTTPTIDGIIISSTLPNQKLLVSGSFGGNYDFDFGTGNYSVTSVNSKDYFMMSLNTGRYNRLYGRVYYDLNTNLTWDAGEPAKEGQILNSGANTALFSTNGQGIYTLLTDSGQTTVHAVGNQPYFNILPSQQNISVSGYGIIDTLQDFALQPMGSYSDLEVTIVELNRGRIGFPIHYNINYYNRGTDTIDNVTIHFGSDTTLLYDSASTAPLMVSPDSLTWNLGTLYPQQHGTIALHFTASIAYFFQLFQSHITLSAAIEPSVDDTVPDNNYDTIRPWIYFAFDPNYKEASPPGSVAPSFITDNNYLKYTIHFQNTGNDSAINISIVDILDITKLDLSTFAMIGSSHPCSYEFYGTNVIRFKLDSIMLPDSTMDEPMSHGYVQFKIRPFNALQIGDSILNNANIYFDFNDPVCTDYAITPIQLPSVPTGIPFTSKSTRITVYPNPFSEQLFLQNACDVSHYKICNYSGQMVLEAAYNEAFISTQGLPEGFYILQLSNKRGQIIDCIKIIHK
jgi:uncharacterized repeat protein (TIGR01451 family)